MKRITLIFLLSVSFVFCRKNDRPLFNGTSCNGSCYILTGRLSEVQNTSPLAGIELKFYYRPAGYDLFYDPTQYLGKATTAADGSYTFKFDSKNYRKPDGSFRIEGIKDGYIYQNAGNQAEKVLTTFYLDSSKINVPQVNDLALYKATTLKFRIKAVSITNFEFLTVDYAYGRNGYGLVLNGNQSIDTTLIYKTAADIPTFISWDALGNGVNIQKKDTVVVSSGTERVYQINL